MYFRLFENVKLVRGFEKAVLYDLQMGKYYMLSKLVGDLLFEINNRTLMDTFDTYTDVIILKIKRIMDDLVSNNLGHFLIELDSLPPLPEHFETPSVINGLTIIVHKKSTISEIISLYLSLKIRFLPQLSLIIKPGIVMDLYKLLLELDKLNMYSITLIAPYQLNVSVNPHQLEQLKKVHKCVYYAAPIVETVWVNVYQEVVCSTNTYHELVHVNGGRLNNFVVNMDLYMESKLYHNYFYKHLTIDLSGLIYRGIQDEKPSCRITDMTVKELFRTEYGSYGAIRKDDVVVCRDCHFRYMCVDSRLPFKSSEDQVWQLPTTCDFNPYIAKWNTEEGYQTVMESIADGIVSEEFVYRPCES